MVFNNKKTIILIILLIFIAGCGSCPSQTPNDPISSAQEPIINGIPSDPSQDSVVFIAAVNSNSSSACSGTIVAPNLILTARHCITTVKDEPFSCQADGSLNSNSKGGVFISDWPISQLYIFKGQTKPDYLSNLANADGLAQAVFHPSSSEMCDGDIALILLQQPLKKPTIATLHFYGPVIPGDIITAVGYGLDQSGTIPAYRLQRKDIPILRVGPVSATNNTWPVAINEFEVGEAICQGDSGGPAFDINGAVIGLVSAGGNGRAGTTSNAAEDCIGSDTRNYYTRISGYRNLIFEAFQQSGYQPKLAGSEVFDVGPPDISPPVEERTPTEKNGYSCNISRKTDEYNLVFVLIFLGFLSLIIRRKND
jgi:hypothetical protein